MNILDKRATNPAAALDGTELVYVAQLGADAVTTVQDIITASATQAIAASVTATTQAGIATAQAVIATNQANIVLAETVNQTKYPVISAGSPSVIVCGIDSLTAGAGASTFRTDLSKIVRATHGDSGIGWVGINNTATTDMGVSFFRSAGLNYVDIADGIYGQYSLDGYGLYTLAGDGAMYTTLTPSSYWTNARVFYLKKSGGGSFLTKIASLSDATGTTISCDNETTDIAYTDITNSLTGSQGVALRSWTGDVTVFGVLFTIAGTKGVVVANIAKGGRTLQSVASQNSATRQKWYQLLAASDLLLNGGMNDRFTRTAAQHNTDLTTIITDVQTGCATTRVAVIQSNESSDHASTYLDAYYYEKFAVAQAKKCTFLDIRRALGNYTQANSYGFMYDSIHPNSLANSIIAQYLASYLGLTVGGKDPGATAYPSGAAAAASYSGTLTTKQSNSLSAGAAVTLYTLGLVAGSPIACVRFRVAMNRTGTAVITVKDYVLRINNTTVANTATGVGTPAVTALLTEVAGDSNSISFTLTAAIASGKAVITLTNTSIYTGAYVVTADYTMPYTTVAGTQITEN